MEDGVLVASVEIEVRSSFEKACRQNVPPMAAVTGSKRMDGPLQLDPSPLQLCGICSTPSDVVRLRGATL